MAQAANVHPVAGPQGVFSGVAFLTAVVATFLTAVVATVLLLGGILAIGDQKNQPAVALLVVGMNSGYALNLARDVGGCRHITCSLPAYTV